MTIVLTEKGKKMARYIDENAVISAIENRIGSLDTEADKQYAKQIIKSLDMVEVVRCKDCVHYNNKACRKLHTMQIKRTDFCSFGERRM